MGDEKWPDEPGYEYNCEKCQHALSWDGTFWWCPVHGYEWAAETEKTPEQPKELKVARWQAEADHNDYVQDNSFPD